MKSNCADIYFAPRAIAMLSVGLSNELDVAAKISPRALPLYEALSGSFSNVCKTKGLTVT